MDILKYIENCATCAENNGSVSRPVPIQSYPIPNEPWETVAIDLLTLAMTTEGHKYLLVAIDHFSRFSILVLLKDKQAKSVARALIDELFCKYNTPKVLLSDNGTEFNNQMLSSICDEYSITKCNVLAYHPASNGMVERQNRKIIRHLCTLVGDVSSTWHEWMPQIMASLNSSLHKSIGDTPHFIIYGQDKRLPFNFLLKEEEPIYNFDDYVRVRSTDFKKIYKRISQNIADSKATMNESQWRKANDKIIVIGDLVYHQVHEPKNKLAPRFEGPYRVIDYDKGNQVKLRHLTSMETKLAHVDHLKRWTRPNSPLLDTDDSSEPPSPEVPPGDNTANTDSLEYRKKLRSHKGD